MEGAGEVEGAGDGPAEAAPAAAGGGGGSGGGGGAGGPGGVGHSTGKYDNRTLWRFLGDGEVEITCYSSRLIHQNMPDEEVYRTVPFQHTGSGNVLNTAGYGFRDDTHVQVTTPWKLIDCNAWGVWFCPSDWQHLVTTCDRLEIVDLQQEIFNVVVKTVTEIGPADARVKQYANDLTACMMIAEDSNNILPYTPAAMRGATLGFFPWKPCTIPTYRYYSDWTSWVRPTSSTAIRGTVEPTVTVTADSHAENQPNQPTTVQTFTHKVDIGGENKKKTVTRATQIGFAQNWTSSQFFCVESQIPIDMIRTGDSWSSGRYSFKCAPMDLTYNWQVMRQLGMPPIPKTLPSNAGGMLTLQPVGERLGAYWGQTAIAEQGIFEATIMRPTTLGYQFPEWVFMDTGGGPSALNAPGGNRRASDAPYWTNAPHSFRFNEAYGAGSTQIKQWTTTSIGAGAAPWNKRNTWIQKNMNGKQVNTGELLGVELVPNNTNAGDARAELGLWLPHDLNTYSPYTSVKLPSHSYPWGQIWDKRPDCEIKAQAQPTAPFLVDNPPGQILTKLAPNLTETYDQNGNTYSRIVTYADYWWKGKITFRAKLRVPSQWNLHQFMNYSPTQGENDLRRYMPDAIGKIELPYLPSQWIPKKIY
uniref:VP2 n=1 Tax=Bat parvovirus TaxID=1514704 RepID=A0A894JCN6_9VIRU|nr:VP2 [Bat parvovirus]